MDGRGGPARRKLAGAAETPLVGGSVCLDLANTTGARATAAPRERLRRYDDLLVWSRRAGLLRDAAARRLRHEAVRRPADAAAALERLRALREEIYALFRAVAEGSRPDPAALARLGALWRAERGRRELVAKSGRFSLEPRPEPDALDGMLWPVVADAVELLTSDRLERLKRCGECDWLFLDESKNASRTWCKKQCGDRIRARRHYDRVRRRRAQERGRR